MDGLDWHRQDVLIVGSSPTGAFSRIFLGSSAGKIVRHASVPVIVVPWDPSSVLPLIFVIGEVLVVSAVFPLLRGCMRCLDRRRMSWNCPPLTATG
jgi:hypothetical protein